MNGQKATGEITGAKIAISVIDTFSRVVTLENVLHTI